MRGNLARLLAALIMAGCSSSAPASSPTITSSIRVQATPGPSAVVSAAPTATPLSPTPASSAAVTRTAEYVVAWQSDVYAEADVVVAVQNTGTTWIELSAGESDYTVYDSGGGVQLTGTFAYAYPLDLAPGQTGYLADNPVTADARAKQLKRVETSVYFTEIDQADARLLTTARIANRKAQSIFDGPTTAGTVTNTSAGKVDDAVVGAFYFDGSGNLLGFSSTNLVQNLEPGQTKGFTTIDGAPYILLSQIKKTIVFAAPDF